MARFWRSIEDGYLMLKEGTDNVKVFSRRAIIVAGLQVGLLGVMGGRLAWLQLIQGQKYRVLSDNNRINVRIIPPRRGEIIDRYGVPLAVNENNYRVLCIPEEAGDLQKSLHNLSRYIRLDQNEIYTAIKKASKSSKFVPIEVKSNLEWEDVAKIEVNITELPGLQIDKGEVRTYPYGSSTAHIVGYVGSVSEKDMDGSALLKLPGYKIGKDGIEKEYDLDMRGAVGNKKMEVNVRGREVRELEESLGASGKRIALTIDGELQRFLHARLEAEKSASAVVLDAHTGEIYAMSSYPSYDPNILSRGISEALWQELLTTPGNPLSNKAIAGQYPPASTFKMVTALAGLRSGHINEDTKSYCSGHYEYGSDRFHCWKSSGHGSVDVVSALTESCDVYFYQVATEIGIEKIAEMARELGLGSKLAFDLAQERPGLVPDKQWKLGRGEVWRPGNTIISSIGQGSLLATPLQIAIMNARMVNGGYAVKPQIISSIDDRKIAQEIWPKMNLAPEHLELVKEGMSNVVNDPKGTAYGSRIEEVGMEMAGKTGTAQVQRITKAQRATGVKNEDLPWEQRHHALFTGYAPANNPKYVCSVVVEHGVGGSRTAAPIAHELLYEAQKRGAGNSQPPNKKKA
ncbi:penicillin-binding protein 2 [Alphaproteobacteria bacterium]|nr:penicillin-binding protein 2 [Alphaproteobacteria bacterium]